MLTAASTPQLRTNIREESTRSDATAANYGTAAKPKSKKHAFAKVELPDFETVHDCEKRQARLRAALDDGIVVHELAECSGNE